LIACPDVPLPPRTLWRERLTPREAQIISLVAEDMSNREISEALIIGLQTVKFHLTNAYLSLGVRSRVGAARWWWEHVEMPTREAA
jgi:DNA-binding CsgD family transcriptional regulator